MWRRPLQMVPWYPTRPGNGVRILALAAAVSLSLSAPQTPAAPPPAAQLTILAPVEGAYVSGETTLRAQLDPPDAASAVVFFVDGRQRCVVAVAPFECESDAGRTIAEHQVQGL